MKPRKIVVALLMMGLVALYFAYSMKKTPPDIPMSVDMEINFPLDDED